MKLLIPIGLIPEGSRITKATGSKIYRVRDSIKLFCERDGALEPIPSNPGSRFMSPEGEPDRINAVSTEKVVSWILPKALELIVLEHLENS